MAIYSRKKDKDGKVTKTFRNPITGRTRTIVKYKEADGRKRKQTSVRSKKQQAEYEKSGGHYQMHTSKSKDKSQWEVGGPKYKQFNKDLRGDPDKGHKVREKGWVSKHKYRKGEPGEKGYKKGKNIERRAIFGPGLGSVQSMLKRDHVRKGNWKRHKQRSKADFAKHWDMDMDNEMDRKMVNDWYVKNPKRVFFRRKSGGRYDRKRSDKSNNY